MNIHIAAKYMQLGYRIRRASWTIFNSTDPWISWETMTFHKLTKNDLVADDWEIITKGIVKNFPIIYQE